MGIRVAAEFASDPSVQEAKRALLEAYARHQKQLDGVRPPDPGSGAAYSDLVRRFDELRGGSLFYPYLGSGFGSGPLVELTDGSVKYDFITGIGVHSLGHGHPAILEASLNAALSGTVMQGNLQQDAAAAPLLETLLGSARRNGAALAHAFLTTSGAMANENALKLIFHKKHPAGRLLAFEGCFMGRTLALAQVTDNPLYRKGLPPTLRVDYVPFFDHSRPEESAKASVGALERHLSRNPGEYAGMVFELVQGEGGFYPGEREFFVSLMDVLREEGVAVMVDEIQTFGRTTELFAFQHFGLDRYVDVVTIGKLSQACATLFREDFRPLPGLVSQTFTAGTAAIHASKAVIETLLGGGYYGPRGKISRIHAHFEERLGAMERRHPGRIAGPFGLGAMIAFTVFDGGLEMTKKFLHALFEAGVIGFYAGAHPARVRFLVPFGSLSFEDIDAALEIVERTLLEFSPAGE